jgi:ADP-ribosyltransferase exoenzyme
MPQTLSDTLTLSALMDAPQSGHPGFTFDAKVQRYRYKDSGKFVPKAAFEKLTTDHILRKKAELRKIGDRFTEKGSFIAFQKDGWKTVKTTFAQQYILGRGGVGKMADSDYATLKKELRYQSKVWRGFAVDIKAGNVSPAQMQMRLGMYGEASKVAFFDGQTAAAISAGMTEELNVMNPSLENCEGCIERTNRGWQSIGTLGRITKGTPCMVHCGCGRKTRKGKKRSDAVKMDKPCGAGFIEDTDICKATGSKARLFASALVVGGVLGGAALFAHLSKSPTQGTPVDKEVASPPSASQQKIIDPTTDFRYEDDEVIKFATQPLTYHEKQSLEAYQGGAYREINRFLQATSEEDLNAALKSSPGVAHRVDGVDKALDKLPPFDGKNVITGYKTVRDEDGETEEVPIFEDFADNSYLNRYSYGYKGIDSLKAGQILVDPRYGSFTAQQEPNQSATIWNHAEKNKDNLVVYRLKPKKEDSNGRYLGSSRSESEVLFKRDTKFKIEKIEQQVIEKSKNVSRPSGTKKEDMNIRATVIYLSEV